MKTTLRYIATLLILLTTFIHAETTWSTGAYTNNEDRNQTLSVENASKLTVTVSGVTEANYDYMYIYDANGNEIKKLHGNINETFTVNSGSIRARFTSDHSQVRSGVTVTVVDANVVTPIDTTKPTITLLIRDGRTTEILRVGETFTNRGATATDDIDGNLTANIITSGTVDTNNTGVYTITYNVKDAAGNVADEVRRTVVVSDISISIVPDAWGMSERIAFIISDAGVVTAYDTVDGNITNQIVVSGDTLDTTTEGTYNITYSVSNSSGSDVSMKRKIYVKPGLNMFEMISYYNYGLYPYQLYVTKVDTGERVKLESADISFGSTNYQTSFTLYYKDNLYYIINNSMESSGGEFSGYYLFGKYDAEPIERKTYNEGGSLGTLKEVNGVLYGEISLTERRSFAPLGKQCLVFDGEGLTTSVMIDKDGNKFDTPCGADGVFNPN